MPNKTQIKKIKQSGLQRQFAISLAGASSGARLLSNRAASLFLSADDRRESHQKALAREAKLFTQQLGELKGAYVKIGQMMALYGDGLLPKEVTDALHHLEHKTSSLEWLSIEPVLKTTLGNRYCELQIDQKPVAAASLAQLHRATCVKDGRSLCIKVQYPGVAETIDSDFRGLMQMLRLTRWVQSGRDVEIWMKDIKAMLVDEVDYLREKRMTERVAELLSGNGRYIVPTIEGRYSTENILTMDYIEGYEVTNPAISRLSQGRRNALAISMLDVFFKEVFEWGIMQTDPNFGNYRVQLSKPNDSDMADVDKLVLLDFGAVRELDATFLTALRKTIIASYRQDKAQVIEGAIELNCLRNTHPERVKESFADFCMLLMEPFRKDKSDIPHFALNSKNQYKWHMSNLMKRAGKLGAKSVAVEGFSPPPKEFALIARKLSGVFTFVTTLRAEINAYKIIEKYL